MKTKLCGEKYCKIMIQPIYIINTLKGNLYLWIIPISQVLSSTFYNQIMRPNNKFLDEYTFIINLKLQFSVAAALFTRSLKFVRFMIVL